MVALQHKEEKEQEKEAPGIIERENWEAPGIGRHTKPRFQNRARERPKIRQPVEVKEGHQMVRCIWAAQELTSVQSQNEQQPHNT